jgi:hypothetical protein
MKKEEIFNEWWNEHFSLFKPKEIEAIMIKKEQLLDLIIKTEEAIYSEIICRDESDDLRAILDFATKLKLWLGIKYDESHSYDIDIKEVVREIDRLLEESYKGVNGEKR